MKILLNWKFENLLESRIMPMCCCNMCTLFWYVLECWIGHGCWCVCMNRFGGLHFSLRRARLA